MTKAQAWIARIGGALSLFFGLVAIDENETFAGVALWIFGGYAIWKGFGRG